MNMGKYIYDMNYKFINLKEVYMTEALMKRPKLNAVQVLAVGFVLVISIGAVLLSLPISSANNEYTNFLDSLFTSTSAVCVTGLVTLDTGTYWSNFGKTVIMLLIETGGLGFMSFTVYSNNFREKNYS